MQRRVANVRFQRHVSMVTFLTQPFKRNVANVTFPTSRWQRYVSNVTWPMFRFQHHVANVTFPTSRWQRYVSNVMFPTSRFQLNVATLRLQRDVSNITFKTTWPASRSSSAAKFERFQIISVESCGNERVKGTFTTGLVVPLHSFFTIFASLSYKPPYLCLPCV